MDLRLEGCPLAPPGPDRAQPAEPGPARPDTARPEGGRTGQAGFRAGPGRLGRPMREAGRAVLASAGRVADRLAGRMGSGLRRRWPTAITGRGLGR